MRQRVLQQREVGDGLGIEHRLSDWRQQARRDGGGVGSGRRGIEHGSHVAPLQQRTRDRQPQHAGAGDHDGGSGAIGH